MEYYTIKNLLICLCEPQRECHFVYILIRNLFINIKYSIKKVRHIYRINTNLKKRNVISSIV